MPKVTSNQTNWSSGEISPLALGRFDINKYNNSAKVVENFLINQLGGVGYRPGTRYLAGCKNDDKIARLMAFQYSSAQDYVIEMGDQYMRFFANDGTTITITSWGDTTLLLHGDGDDESVDIIDEIGNTVTPYGNAQIDTAYQKFGTGSILFDGTGDYLRVPVNDDMNFGTGDFTIDFWVCPNISNGSQYFLFDYTPTGEITIQRETDNTLRMAIDGNYHSFGSWTPTNGTWYHLAFVRSGTNVYCFVDGTQLGSTWTSVSYTVSATGDMYIGTRVSGADSWNGHIDEFRISKTARWTADFTAPTTPYAKTSSSELTTEYLEADLLEVMQAHKNDVKYLTHNSYEPQKLSRVSADEFAIADVSFVRGPFLDDNTTATTITPSAATGIGITITASSSLFDALHVGSLWKINAAVVKITAVASGTSATADVQEEPDGTAGNIGGTAAYTDWAEGAFSGYRGYPAACAFHDGRLYYGGTTHEPQKIWGSVKYAYDNFDADDASDEDAVTFEIATEERNAIRWLMSSQSVLAIGTNGGTFSAAGASNASITPDSIQITRDTNYGVAQLAPKRLSSFIYYIQRNLNKLREIVYNYEIESKVAQDMNLLADHVIKDGSGASDIDYQQSPNDRIWIVRNDGQIAVLTRNPEQQVMGWSRLIAGSDSQGAGEFESVAVIPKTSADDQVWVIVKRVINGTTKRFIEYFTPEDFDEDWDAVQVDSSVTMDNPKTITGATAADPVVITAVAHGFSDGDQVKINGIVGMTELNLGIYLVANKTDDTFELTDLDGVDIDGTAYTAYISGGEVRKMVTAISGLGHFEGEDVYVQADGVALDDTFTVASGAITLTNKAAVTHVGLKYDGMTQLLKYSDGSATGTGQTKNRRVYLSAIRVYRSLSMKVGKTASTLDTVYFGATNDEVVTALYTGDLNKFFQTWWDENTELIIKQDKPNPLNILCVITRSEVQD